MKQGWALALLMISTGIQASGPFWQPSFDCKQAISVAQRAICNSPLLASHDRYVARLYNELKTEDQTIVQAHERWLSELDKARSFYDLPGLYSSRITELNKDRKRLKKEKYKAAFEPRMTASRIEIGIEQLPNMSNLLIGTNFNFSSEEDYYVPRSRWTVLAYEILSDDYNRVALYIRSYLPWASGENYGSVRSNKNTKDFTLEVVVDESGYIKGVKYFGGVSGYNYVGFMHTVLEGDETICRSLYVEKNDQMVVSYGVEPGRFKLRGRLSDRTLTPGYGVLSLYNDSELIPIAYVEPEGDCDNGMYLELNQDLSGFAESAYNKFVTKKSGCYTRYIPLKVDDEVVVGEMENIEIRGLWQKAVVSLYRAEKGAMVKVCQ